MYKRIIAYGRSSTFRNFGFYGFGQAFNLITPLLVIPYIISVCGLELYGKAAIGMALMFFLMVFIDFGSDITGVREIATNRHDALLLQRIIGTTYYAKFLMLTVVVVIVSGVFLSVPYFAADRAMYFLSLPILVGQFLNPTWILQGIEDFKQITVINILSKLIYLIGIFLFVTGESDYGYINLLWGIGMIVANAISVYLVIRKYRVLDQKLQFGEVRGHLKSGFPIFFSQLFVSIQLYAPLLLIGFLGTAILAGIYRVVDQVIVIFKTYILLFFNFTFPRVCYLLTFNPQKARQFWGLFNGANLLFIVVSMLLAYYFASPIVSYFTEENQLQILSLFPIAVWIPTLMALSVPLKQLVLGYGFNRFYVRTTVIVVLINVGLILSLLPIMGAAGVLLAIIIAELLTVVIFLGKIKNKFFLAAN